MMDFFKENEEYRLKATYYGCETKFTLEELYQAFKARMLQEVVTDVHGTSHYGLLVNRPSAGDPDA
jgi:hypothetical protein